LAYVGARLKEIRLGRGLSQDDLAYGIPCDRSHIGQIENGKAAPTVLTILKLAVALDCELTDLLPSLSDAQALLRAHGRKYP
jgi:transcriptional regulator with XRE-family HTH domain